MQANMLQEGQEILEGRFKIIKKLGSGAFGEIFKGNFHLLDSSVTSFDSTLESG
jgi:hypothetical protein